MIIISSMKSAEIEFFDYFNAFWYRGQWIDDAKKKSLLWFYLTLSESIEYAKDEKKSNYKAFVIAVTRYFFILFDYQSAMKHLLSHFNYHANILFKVSPHFDSNIWGFFVFSFFIRIRFIISQTSRMSVWHFDIFRKYKQCDRNRFEFWLSIDNTF